jgi:hypothetical protein
MDTATARLMADCRSWDTLTHESVAALPAEDGQAIPRRCNSRHSLDFKWT